MRPILLPTLSFLLLVLPLLAKAEEERRGRRLDIEWFRAEDPADDLFLCVFLPYEGCRHTIDSSIGYGGGRGWGVQLQWEEPNDYTQLYIDLAYLKQVVDRPSLQLGASLGYEMEIFDESLRHHFFATVRGRLWAGSWVTAEVALGMVGSFDGDWRYCGIGGLGELALTLHGHLGLYVNSQVISGPTGVETRVTGGFRGSLVTWLAILIGLGG